MPKYRKVRTSNDKHVPEFMRIAYPDYAQRDQENLCAMGIRGLFAIRRVQLSTLKIMQSLAEQLRSKQDSGTLMQYQKHPYFDQYMRSRILYDDKAIEQLYNNEKNVER